MNWFICKVSYWKMMENGKEKKVSESYLVDALSFSEAEACIIEEMALVIDGEFIITDIRRYPLPVLFFNESGDMYYKARIALITLDERSGKEKKTKVSVLAQASDIMEAKTVIEQGMKEQMVDYVIEKIEETKIMDVFHFKQDES